MNGMIHNSCSVTRFEGKTLSASQTHLHANLTPLEDQFLFSVIVAGLSLLPWKRVLYLLVHDVDVCASVFAV